MINKNTKAKIFLKAKEIIDKKKASGEKYDLPTIVRECTANDMSSSDPAYREYIKDILSTFAKRSGAKRSAAAKKRRLSA